jgi:flagellar basal-body rod modification protein FlgD
MSVTPINGVNQVSNAPVAKGSSSLDKNAFLKILVAELSNQDPTQQKDSTAYIAQLAQFSSLEQMTNLNSSVTFSNATSLVGKTAWVSDTDSANSPYYGQVLGVSKNGDTITLSMKVTDSGNGTTSIKQFDLKNVTDVANTVTVPTTTTGSTTTDSTSKDSSV